MHEISGGCHCGNIAIHAQLTAAPDTYHPRACDCDFCRKHGAAWLSDANGALLIRIEHPQDSSTYRQGSGQAELLLCKNCGVLVAVLHRSGQRLHAAVNARAIDAAPGFGTEQAVSPQKLSAGEKVSRWEDLWFANVELSS